MNTCDLSVIYPFFDIISISLSELPECQLAIAKNHDITMQIIFVLSSVHYSCKLAIVAISIFTCIAQSVDSCPYLLTIEVVSGLLRACDVRSQHAKNAKDIHEMNAFRYGKKG